MNQRIPAGVVTTTDKLTTELQRSDAVNPDDIAQLWRVYTTQSSKIQDAVACRLENLFWRLWANPKLQKRLTGVTLATLFMAIHESRSAHTIPRSSKTTDTQPTKVTIVTITHQHDGPGSRKGAKNPLPPILKKNSSAPKSQPPSEPSSYKTARIVTPDQPTKNAGTASATAKATATANMKVAAAGLGSKQTRKRPSFVASTSASSRRRGVVMRRKSPITTPTVDMEEPFPPAVIEEIVERAEETQQNTNPVAESSKPQDHSIVPEAGVSWRSLSYLKSGDEDIPTTTTSMQASLTTSPSSPPPANFSVSSVARHRSQDYGHGDIIDKQQSTAPETVKSTTTTLVDRDFRTHFVERKRHESVGGSKGGGASSSLTSNLSTSQFKDLLKSNNNNTTTNPLSPTAIIPSVSRSLSPTKKAHPAAAFLSNSKKNSPTLSSPQTSPRKRDSNNNNNNRHSGPAPPMAISSISTSQTQLTPSSSSTTTQKTTSSGVFSVSRPSRDIGEQLTSLMRSK